MDMYRCEFTLKVHHPLNNAVQLSKLKRVVWVGSNKSVGKKLVSRPTRYLASRPGDKTAAWKSDPYSNKCESSMQMNSLSKRRL